MTQWPNSARALWLVTKELKAAARAERRAAPRQPRREKSEAEKLQDEIIGTIRALVQLDRVEPLKQIRDYLQGIPLMEPPENPDIPF